MSIARVVIGPDEYRVIDARLVTYFWDGGSSPDPVYYQTVVWQKTIPLASWTDCQTELASAVLDYVSGLSPRAGLYIGLVPCTWPAQVTVEGVWPP